MTDSDTNAIAVRGMSWLVLNTIASRAVVFAAQIVLGWLLSPRDFGLYALALSVSNYIGSVRNGGTSQLLLQRGAQYERIARPLTQYALILNALSMAVLLAVAPLAARAFHSPALGWLIACIGAAFPAGTWANTLRCKLAIDHRFRELAILSTWSTVLWQLQVIGLALLGCGAFSYVVPMVMQGAVEGALGWHYVRRWPGGGGWLRWKEFVALFRETRWVMVGLAALWLGVSGHYVVVGLECDTRTVGLFFFGFQLISTLFVVLNNAIENVLPPTLARLNHDPQAQSRASLDMLRLLMVISFPLSGALAVAGPSVIHILWHGKWDATAPVVSIMAFCIPAWLVIAVVRAVFEARGMWRHRFALLAVYGLGTIGAAALGALGGDLARLSAYLTGFYVALAVLLALVIPRILMSSAQEIGRALLPPAVASFVCVAAATLAGTLSYASTNLGEMASVTVFALAAVCANLFFFRAIWNSALSVFARSPQRGPAA